MKICFADDEVSRHTLDMVRGMRNYAALKEKTGM